MEINQITEKIIGGAIEVHRSLGPGLLESAYEECLCFELKKYGLNPMMTYIILNKVMLLVMQCW